MLPSLTPYSLMASSSRPGHPRRAGGRARSARRGEGGLPQAGRVVHRVLVEPRDDLPSEEPEAPQRLLLRAERVAVRPGDDLVDPDVHVRLDPAGAVVGVANNDGPPLDAL